VQAAINLGNWVRAPILNCRAIMPRNVFVFFIFFSIRPLGCRCACSSCALAPPQKQVPTACRPVSQRSFRLTTLLFVPSDCTAAGAALLDAIVADTRSNALRLTLLKAYRPGARPPPLTSLCAACFWSTWGVVLQWVACVGLMV